MKNIITVGLFLILISSMGCNKDQTITNNTSKNNLGISSSGSILMKIDENVPAGVTKLIATLTRTGFDSLTASINLSGGNSSEINFEKVPIGTWHLKIDATNESNLVLYNGKTDVTIIENTIIQVNLTLNPVATGVGSIKINVSWGTTATVWKDYPGNPIFKKSGQDSLSNGYQDPTILYENGVYKMWFSVVKTGLGIAYATSTDGITWSRNSKSLVLTKGDYSAWDGLAIADAAVIHDGTNYKMYYYGVGNNSSIGQIGLAISQDGINWEKYPNPVLSPVAGTWEAVGVGLGDIIKNDSGYVMIYHGGSIGDIYHIGVAFSSDGISWNKYSGNPVLNKTESWEGNLGIYCPSMIFDNGQYKMVYMGRDYNSTIEAFGFATSSDAKVWKKELSNPFHKLGLTANNWATSDIAHPFIRKIGSEYRIYYSGYGINGKNDWAIGLLKGN